MDARSGTHWVTWANVHARNSRRIEDLDDSFRRDVKTFIDVLEDAGARVEVSATRRDPKRAYLFHWSWKIANGKCRPADADPMVGIGIRWDHGDDAASKAGALEMTRGVNANFALHEVGASYGVRKLRSDAPHWSLNGR